MKVAVAATSADTDAYVDERGARAPYYLILDSETGLFEFFPNPVGEGKGSAGIQVAEFLIGKGVENVIAGEFGERFRMALEKGGAICIQRAGAISWIFPGLDRQGII